MHKCVHACLTITLIFMATDSSALPQFTDLGAYQVLNWSEGRVVGSPPFELIEAPPDSYGNRTAGLAVHLPDANSIHFSGYAENGFTVVGTYQQRRGAFVVDEPTRVRMLGDVSIRQAGSAVQTFDFRIIESVLYTTHAVVFGVEGDHHFDDFVDLSPGTYEFILSISSNSLPGAGVTSFDALLAIPEPSTALLVGLGLTMLGARRRTILKEI